MEILIVGSNGFVGNHFINRLTKESIYDIISCDIINGYDILNPSSFNDISSADVLIHLAAKTYVPASFEKPVETYETNVMGLLNMLEFSRKKDIEKFIFISSYVYGNPQYLPIDENHPLNASNPYTRSKIIGEELCRGYWEDYGLKVDIVRPFNLYGKGQDKRFVIPTIIKQFIEEDENIIINNLKPKRDYLYISDFVDLLIKIVNNKWKKIGTFNAGTGTSFSVKDIIETISNITGIRKNIIEKKKLRKGEIMDTVADITCAKKELKWKPVNTLESALRELLKVNNYV